MDLRRLWLFAACAACAGPPVPAFDAAPWPEADRLFRGDPFWVGADGAYSIDLGEGRVLWLFGDTIIDPTGRRDRSSPGVTMVGNSVGIMRGTDPVTASIAYAWRSGPDERPGAFFADRGTERFWPGHGARLGDALLVFLMRVRNVPEGLGFEVVGTEARLVRDPDAEPHAWVIEDVPLDLSEPGIVVGSAGVFVDGPYLYALGAREPAPNGAHDVFLARVPRADAAEGDLSALAWWTRRGWEEDRRPHDAPLAVLRDAATELTVHEDAVSGRWLELQTSGFGAALVTLRHARSPTGPWSPPETVYEPPERARDDVFLYQGKAHPWLTGADLVVTYATNATTLRGLLDDPAIYYPRFVRLTRRR